MQRYQVKTEFGEVPVHVLHPDAFGGEYQKMGNPVIKEYSSRLRSR